MAKGKPTILHILPYLEQGGTERQPLYLMEALRGRYRFVVLAPPGPLAGEFQRVADRLVHFPRMDQHPLNGLREFKRALGRLLQEEEVALIQIHAAIELLWLTRQVAPETPILFIGHGYLGPSSSLDYRMAGVAARRWADQVIGVSRYVRDKLVANGVPPEKAGVIHNGVPDAFAGRAVTYAGNGALRLGAIARLEPPKGIPDLIKALAEVNQRGIPVELEVAGDGSQRHRLEKLVADLGLTERVTFHGFIPPDQRNEMLLRVDVFVLSSYDEPFGLVCAEAMAAGRALVATAVGGVPEVVAQGETGYLVQPGDWKAMAEAISRLAQDRAACRRMGEAGRERYLKMFSVEKMAGDYDRLYQEMAGRG